MPDIAFKDLVIDAVRPEVVGTFWADLLGQESATQANGDMQLLGEPKERTIWVNGVPEPQTVKNRVHLDVRLPAADTHVLGSTPVSQQDHWRVLADPDGAQFCAFPPRAGEPLGPFELCVDAVDPLAQASWWADRTGGSVHTEAGAPWAWIEGAAGFPWPYWVFNPVPEPKTVKNRLHWDVMLRDASVEDLVALGASVLEVLPSWTVLADPEGNEFCAF